ncbi:MAG: shikimate dehydrogenase [Deltaproteobacteria bacterium]|nr:shikimate dehydrogenase [Deltaproteobacteria bacterium]
MSSSTPLLLGLLGDSRVYKSPSPKMHTRALDYAKLGGYYVPLLLAASDLLETLPILSKLNFQGLNVTAPLKEAVLPHLGELSAQAKKIGAANTLSRDPKDGLYHGHNTDADGFASAYLKDLKASTALVLGAGGAARAVLFALKERGFSPTVMNRSQDKAESLAHEFESQFTPYGESDAFPLVINTTSASSLAELGGSLDIKLQEAATVVDINYKRPDNWFRELAARQGAVFFDGLLMLAHQARLSFMIFTKIKDIPLDPFLDALNIRHHESNRAN